MLKTLLKVRILTLVSWITGASRKKKAQSKGSLIGFAALMLYALGCLGFLFWHVFDTIATPFHAVGLDWLFFAMVLIMAFAMMFVGSVFAAKAQLFEARDNDLLLSLPLKTGDILLSRMFMLAVIALLFGLLTVVPAGMVWNATVGFTAAGLVGFIVTFLALVLLTLALCALFGWVISLLTARVKKKSLVTTLLSLVFLVVYMYFCFNMNTLLTELAAKPDAAAAVVGAVAPLYKLAAAMAAGDLAGVMVAVLLVCAVFAGTYYLLSVTFMSAAAGHKGGKKTKYVEREQKPVAPQKALFRRELDRFLSCSAYIMNCGMGGIMTLAGVVILLIKQDEVQAITSQIPQIGALMPPLAALGLCVLSSMTLISAPSVSLEGKSIWIAQSLPVDTGDILRAKLRLHNLISYIPTLAASAAVAVVLGIGGTALIGLFVLPVLFTTFLGLLGLTENLRHPNLDWTNETQAVKSGIGVMITMFAAWALVAVPAVAIFAQDTLSAESVILGFGALLAVGCVLLYRWLMTKGAMIYMDL